MAHAPIVIDEQNLSLAWARAFQEVTQRPIRKCPPLVVSISGFPTPLPEEDGSLRNVLDEHLAKCGSVRVDTMAMLMFPYKLWRTRRHSSYEDFHKLCVEKLIPRLRGLDTRNKHGTYFERIIAYKGIRAGKACTVDQLKEVIQRMSGPKKFRATGLQISCFDPVRDHTAQPRLGFPCLQQIGITYEDPGGVCITGFYPSQHLFSRAYGNYLGLAHLGRFICDQTQLNLRRVVCITTHPLLGDVRKGDLTELNDAAVRLISKGVSDQ